MTDTSTKAMDAEHSAFLLRQHEASCFEVGVHHLEVETPYSCGAGAINRVQALASERDALTQEIAALKAAAAWQPIETARDTLEDSHPLATNPQAPTGRNREERMMIGDKIKMCSERQRYTVQAFNERFAIMTKPFNARKTYLYSVTDLKRGIRGHFGKWGPPCDVDNHKEAGIILEQLISGELEIIRKNSVTLTDAEIYQLTGATK